MKRSTTLMAGLAAVTMTGSLFAGAAAVAATPMLGAASMAPTEPGQKPEVRRLATPKAGASDLVTARDVNARATSVRSASGLKAPAAVEKQANKVSTSSADATSVATAQLATVAPYFGARPADMKAEKVSRADGVTSVRFQQTIDGVPVYGGQMTTNLDAAGALESASGEVALSTYGSFPKDLAGTQAAGADAARAAVAKRIGQVSSGKTTVAAADLKASLVGPQWFDMSLMSDQRGSIAIPVYVYEVNGADQRWHAMVHASGGMTLLAWDMHQSINRVVCDAERTVMADQGPGVRCGGEEQPFQATRKEGDSPVSSDDVNRVYDYFGDTSDFFQTEGVDLTELIGVDYGDGNGKALRATVRVCGGECPYTNAFWNGEQMAFGEGVSTDDITGHELAHGVTERRIGLAYLWQSGAMNESFSDIFGEFVDLSNGSADDTPENRWLIGEGSTLGAIRSMKNPTQFGDPDRMLSPDWFADKYFQDNGGVHFNSGVGNKAAFLTTDGGSFNGQQISGLGVARSAKLWFDASGRLTSGADYGDLAESLRSTCASLVKNKKVGFTPNDCQQVEKVIKATEMDLEPAVGAAAQAPVCETDQKAKEIWKDSFTTDPDADIVADDAWGLSSQDKQFAGIYSKDGDDSLFTALTGNEEGTYVTASVETAEPITIKESNTYLRFAHAANFYNVIWIFPIESGFATMDYSTDGGATWQSAGDLPWINGPSDYDAEVGKAWQGNSGGWATSRVDLSGLVGQSVQFRLNATATDWASYVPGGMWIDSMEVYSCK